MREAFGSVNVASGEDTKNPRLKVELTIPEFRARLTVYRAEKLLEDLAAAIKRAKELE